MPCARSCWLTLANKVIVASVGNSGLTPGAARKRRQQALVFDRAGAGREARSQLGDHDEGQQDLRGHLRDSASP